MLRGDTTWMEKVHPWEAGFELKAWTTSSFLSLIQSVVQDIISQHPVAAMTQAMMDPYPSRTISH